MADAAPLERLTVALLVKTAQAEDSHYYLPTGEPCHGTLREARKRGAYPSPTSVLGGVLARPGLDFFKQSQAIASAITLPRLPGENDQDFSLRAIQDSRKEVEAAADLGTYVHTLAECAVRGVEPEDLREGFGPHLESLRVFARFVREVHKMEEVVVNHEEGYAGRVDLICEWGDKTEQVVEVVDFKTRKFKKVGTPVPGMAGYATADDPHKVESYDTDLLQLSAYAYAVFDEPVAARSVYIEPKTGAIECKLWEPGQVEEAFEVFKQVLAIWRWQKKYDPRELPA
jgi:hypothetical protein